MSGLRIHHPIARNATVTVQHPRKPYPIRVDNDGCTIVSATIWQRLVEARSDFVFVNEVANPPTQYIGAVAQEFAPEGVIARVEAR